MKHSRGPAGGRASKMDGTMGVIRMQIKKTALRVMSTAAFLTIISSCAAPAFADAYGIAVYGNYYLDQGSISITYDGVNDQGKTQYTVVQGDKTYTDTDGYVTVSNNKNGDTSQATKETITITNNVENSNAYTGDNYADHEKVGDDTSAKVTLKDVNIVAEKGAAISVKGSGDVTIKLDSSIPNPNPDGNHDLKYNKVTGGAGHAGIEKNDDESTGQLVIREAVNDNGKLEVTGGSGAAAIGSAEGKDTSNIYIDNGGIIAKGGDAAGTDGHKDGGAGIGSGAGGNASNITIGNGRFYDDRDCVGENKDNAPTTGITGGKGENGGAGIGSGGGGDVSNITIINGTYRVEGGEGTVNGGAGIGSGGAGNIDESVVRNDEGYIIKKNDVNIDNGQFSAVDGGKGGVNGGAGIGGGGGAQVSAVDYNNGAIGGANRDHNLIDGMEGHIKGGDGKVNGGAGIGGGGNTQKSTTNINGGDFGTRDNSSVQGGGGTNAGASIGGGGGSNVESTVNVNGGKFQDVKGTSGNDSTTSSGAAIGGGGSNKSSTVNVNNAEFWKLVGVKGSAAIGGGQNNGTSTVTINGGRIADNFSDNTHSKEDSNLIQGGKGAAAIGGGLNNGSSSVTINGGALVGSDSSLKGILGGKGGAAIGGGSKNGSSTVTINGGTINKAVGGQGAAAIGSGKKNGSSTVTINNGTISNAQGGKNAAGIGTGAGSVNGTVTIANGTVNATGGENGAGIGGGKNGTGTGTITISGGNVTATGGENAFAIGSSHKNKNGGSHNVFVTGDTAQTIVNAIARIYGTVDAAKDKDIIEGADKTISPDAMGEKNSAVIYFKELTEDAVNWFQTVHNGLYANQYAADHDLVKEEGQTHLWYEVDRQEPTYSSDGYILYACSVENCRETRKEILPRLHDDDDDTPTTPVITPETPDGADVPGAPEAPADTETPGSPADTGADTGSSDSPVAPSNGNGAVSPAKGDNAVAPANAHNAVSPATAGQNTLPQTGQSWFAALAAAVSGFGLMGFGAFTSRKRKQ